MTDITRALCRPLARLEGLARALEDVLLRHQMETELSEVSASLTALLRSYRALQEEYCRVAHTSAYDAVTRLYNQLNFVERLDDEFQRALRYATPLSVLLMDLDDFEAVVDARGYMVGNELLRRVGRVIRQNIRGTDIAGRYDGNTFAMALPQTTSDQATRLAERLQLAVAALPENVRVTIGNACLGAAIDGPLDLLTDAYRSLHRAKTGRTM
jgi:diguanylate cyclase (GGDEF)-like protein